MSRSTSSDIDSDRGWSEALGTGELFCSFTPAVSPSALKAMRATIRDLNIRQRTQLSLDDIAGKLNPLLRGWIEYYGRYTPSALHPMLRYVNLTLASMGDAEVQALHGAQDPRQSLSAKTGSGQMRSLRTLATRHDRHVCLMGAV